jgi:DNA repair exonuclease SbcCD ATPase subunit
MNAFSRSVLGCLAGLAAGGAAAVLAQGKSEPTDGSFAALTSEVRQLRVAVEESTRSQTQTQALAVYLSVQQSRILAIATRLDEARKELDSAATRSREVASELESIRTDLLRVTEPQRHAALEDLDKQLKGEQQRAVFQEQQARIRQNELSQALQIEETRWTDLISRLEQLIKR